MACLAISILSGCAGLNNQGLPTILPSEYLPTVIALTLEAQGISLPIDEQPTSGLVAPSDRVSFASPEASATQIDLPPTLSIGSTQVTATALDTPTPPADIPYAKIQILNPGPASRLPSPFLMRAFLAPGPNGVVKIELLGEDGRLLMRELKRYDVPEGTQMNTAVEMNFEIQAVAEIGRVQVSIEDNNGKVVALASVDVILLSLGEADTNPPGDLLETIVIREPAPNTLIQGGIVWVYGLARPRTGQPLMIELRSSDDRIVGTRQVAVTLPPDGNHGIFAIDVPYNIDTPTKARVIVWEKGDRIPGIAHLSSLEVMLSP